jgi:hypothetical protein
MNTKVSAVFSIVAIAAAVLLFAADPVMAATTPTTVVNPCPVNTIWLGGNTCQLVNGYGSGFAPGYFGPGYFGPGYFGPGYFGHHY